MLFKKLFRTAKEYKAQFISMIIMVALGVGVFLGFNMEWKSIEQNTEKFFEETRFADYRLVSADPMGFSEENLDKIAGIEGVEAASRYVSENATVNDTMKTVALTVTENKNVSFFKLMSGEEYDENSENGVWLSQKFADENNIKAGDEIKFTYASIEFNGVVKGLVKSGEHAICIADKTQIMPKFDSHGFAYISPAFYKKVMGAYVVYPQINVLTDLSKDEFSKKADEVLQKTTLVLTRDEVVSSAGAKGEIEEGQTMGSIIPVMFLLIGILTMVTTMHRITVKEKTQIGTLKALGFKDKTITRHYTSYAFAIGFIGSVLGFGVAYIIVAIIINPKGMMGTYLDMPYWKFYTPWYCYLIVAGIITALTFIGYLSVKNMLKGTAADALRPYVPKKMKNLAVEKTKFWDKLPFGAKWNLRDVARHKARTGMSLIGVIGCVIILVGSLGMRDTMKAFLSDYYDTQMNYEYRLNLSADITEEKADKIIENVNGDYSASVSIEYGGKPISLDIYGVKNGYVNFLSSKKGSVKVPDTGALVSTRIFKDNNLSVGSEIIVKPYGTDKEFKIKVADQIRSTSESIIISPAYAESLGIDYAIDSVYTKLTDNKALANTDGVKSVQSKQEIMNSFDSFTGMLNQSVTILIVAGILLGLIVLYNLGVMSYVERYRELATLKVVGFKDKKISGILISQNLWTTLFGSIIGVPLGIGLLKYLCDALAPEYELRLVVSALTVLIAIVATFATSFVVSFVLSKKNKKIDMVEALKGVE